MNPYEETFDICPFDPNHSISSCKMQMHIVRCRKNHPNAKIKKCPYNSRHYAKLAEFDDHVANCPSRKIETFNYQEEYVQELDILPIESGLRIPGDNASNPSKNTRTRVKQQEHHQIVDILPIESALRIPGGTDWSNEPEVSKADHKWEKKLISQTKINSNTDAVVQNTAKNFTWKNFENTTDSRKVEPNTSSNMSQASEKFTQIRHNKQVASVSSPSNQSAVPFSYANALKKSSTDSTSIIPGTLDINRNCGKENVQDQPRFSGFDIQQLSEKVDKLNMSDKYRKNRK